MNKIDTTQPLIICEGQSDCLSLIECGYTNAVSIPGGTENMKWVEYNFDWLEKFDKIILWFDSDEAGVKARKEASSRLGVWRIKYIEIPEELRKEANYKIKDVNEVLFFQGKEYFYMLLIFISEIFYNHPLTSMEFCC